MLHLKTLRCSVAHSLSLPSSRRKNTVERAAHGAAPLATQRSARLCSRAGNLHAAPLSPVARVPSRGTLYGAAQHIGCAARWARAARGGGDDGDRPSLQPLSARWRHFIPARARPDTVWLSFAAVVATRPEDARYEPLSCAAWHCMAATTRPTTRYEPLYFQSSDPIRKSGTSRTSNTMSSDA